MLVPASWFSALLPMAAAVVRESGELIREHDRKPRRVRFKASPKDLVTETDVAVEALLKTRLSVILPEAGFLGEEGSVGLDQASLGLSGLKWVVDPVDGTTNFAHGVPFVATSVALCQDGEPLLALVNLPLLGELFTAIKGQGAWLNGEAMHVSAARTLPEALVATGFPYRIEEHGPAILRQLARVMPATQGLRRAGAAALDLAFVACGRFEGFFEFALNPWDTAAGVLLVEEAGGRVGRMDGRSPYRLGDADILATNGLVHDALAGLLTDADATAP